MVTVDLGRTIRAYDYGLVRAYCWGRFKILRQPFLDEIGQYLPPTGRVLDIGCGFGLFSLYFAQRFPALQIVGVDLNARRIAVARQTAARLGVTNVTYEVGDASTLSIAGTYDGVYMLDVAHHIPQHTVEPLIREVYRTLEEGGRFLLKDVDTEPAWKRWFTWLLDRMMDRRGPLRYWPRAEMVRALEAAGFEVFSHAMPDILPYPHLLYICRKSGTVRTRG